METRERMHTYRISGYRLMRIVDQTGIKSDVEEAEGTFDEVLARRKQLLDQGCVEKELYIQAHWPLGHPEYPGSHNVWIKYDFVRGQ